MLQAIKNIFGSDRPAPVRVEPTMGGGPTPSAEMAESGVQHPEQWLVTSIGGRSYAGKRVTEASALTVSAVTACVRILTGTYAMTPLIYYRRTGEASRERAVDDPIYALFHDAPNGYQSAFAYKELQLADILLAGKHVAWVSRDRRQVVTGLTRLEPSSHRLAWQWDRRDGYTLFHDVTLPDGSTGRFSGRDIWYVPGFTRDGLTGLNPLRVMKDVIGTSLATGEHAAKFFANGAQPGVTINAPEGVKIDAEQKRQMKSDWNDLHQGAGNAHKVAVLDQGMEAATLTIDNEKSQFNETRTFQVGDVARAFGVPPHLIGELSKATFSNIEQQSLEYVIYHMGPHYARFAGAANLAFAAPGHFLEFLVDALVRGDIKTRTEAQKMQREAGVLNADEIRAMNNMNPIGGPAGQTYLRPANMVPADSPAPGQEQNR